MKASLALCLLAPALLIIPAKAARLALPPVPHYELPTPQLPKPATPPRYTEDYQEREPSRRRGDDESKNHKCFWECVVAVWRGIINDPVAFVTLSLVAVACVQAALFVWQLILIGKNLQDAKKAAEAAGESAKGTLETVRVLRNAQRPYLSPFEPTLGNYDQAIRNDDASLVRIDVQLDITNVGPGVGFIRSCCITDEICVRDSQGSKPLRVNDYIGRFPLHQHGKWNS